MQDDSLVNTLETPMERYLTRNLIIANDQICKWPRRWRQSELCMYRLICPDIRRRLDLFKRKASRRESFIAPSSIYDQGDHLQPPLFPKQAKCLWSKIPARTIIGWCATKRPHRVKRRVIIVSIRAPLLSKQWISLRVICEGKYPRIE